LTRTHSPAQLSFLEVHHVFAGTVERFAFAIEKGRRIDRVSRQVGAKSAKRDNGPLEIRGAVGAGVVGQDVPAVDLLADLFDRRNRVLLTLLGARAESSLRTVEPQLPGFGLPGR
jgi:hypothetical protein